MVTLRSPSLPPPLPPSSTPPFLPPLLLSYPPSSSLLPAPSRLNFCSPLSLTLLAGMPARLPAWVPVLLSAVLPAYLPDSSLPAGLPV